IFDILPTHGHLQPGDQQAVTFSFYGHENISRQVVAQCHVEDGPTYEIILRGHASEISYTLDTTHLDFGQQVRIQGTLILTFLTGEVDVTLTNTGKVGFKYSIHPHREEEDEGVAEECYSDVLQQARTAVEKDGVKEKLIYEFTVQGGAATEATHTLTYEDLLHMEIERLLVKKNALAVANNLLETEEPQESFRKWNKLIKFQLPEYILDFGFVIPGKVVSRAVKVSNNGSIPVSFHPTNKHLGDTGFTVDFESMKNQPRDETKSFTVKFDPQGVNLDLGYTSAILPIQVAGGPTVQVRLCAVVTMPAVTVSSDTIQFDTLQCGMCQVHHDNNG
ncbi:hydrocephalus-inducing protein homolog, partial [Haplochromis burtoni]|uniref:hydrocephalus-inducing protein homolog n=1 Tax=Haplochromis burtoni TaxID=8153 RepID=UPI001C2DDAAD